MTPTGPEDADHRDPDGAEEGDPTRTCVACRQPAQRDELVRMARAPDGEVVIDYRARLPGRGAWAHPARACLDLLSRQPGRLERAFKAPVVVGDLAGALSARIHEALMDGLSQSAAAGALLGGHDVLEQALANGLVLEVLVASDASERTIDDLRRVAGSEVPFTVVPIDRETLGRRIGKGARAALGVTRSRAATHLLRQLRRLRSLG